MSQVVVKFPEEAVRAQMQVLLLPLLTRLVNDPSALCRQKVGWHAWVWWAEVGEGGGKGIPTVGPCLLPSPRALGLSPESSLG